MALSLFRIAALKSAAEQDAKAFLAELIALRRKDVLNEAAFEKARKDIQLPRLGKETDGLTLPGDINEVCAFYVGEFNRAVESLWDVLMAASGGEGRKA